MATAGSKFTSGQLTSELCLHRGTDKTEKEDVVQFSETCQESPRGECTDTIHESTLQLVTHSQVALVKPPQGPAIPRTGHCNITTAAPRSVSSSSAPAKPSKKGVSLEAV
jgi:hypothetical protein